VSERWRGVVAALLNPDLRAALAEVTGEPQLTPARRERALARLEEVGMLRRTSAGLEVDEAHLRALLAEGAAVRPTGPERHLDSDGRIDRYPAREDDRRELLAWAAASALAPDEVLTEAQLGERLMPLARDVALLRRHLVDAGFLERTPSGSSYARAAPGSI
jgi:hypothetical protein